MRLLELLGNFVVALFPDGILPLAPVRLSGGRDADGMGTEEVGVDVCLVGVADAEAAFAAEGAEEFGHGALDRWDAVERVVAVLSTRAVFLMRGWY